MYTTYAPCFDCAKLIIQAGVSRVVYSEEYRITKGIEFLKQFNIDCDLIQEGIWNES